MEPSTARSTSSAWTICRGKQSPRWAQPPCTRLCSGRKRRPCRPTSSARLGGSSKRRPRGSPFLFLQGAAGNICPASGIGAGGPEQFDDQLRLGAMLGGEVVKTWGQIRTHNRRGPRRIVKSVATLSTWDYESVPAECIEHFGVARKRLVLDMAPLPDRLTIQEQARPLSPRARGGVGQLVGFTRTTARRRSHVAMGAARGRHVRSRRKSSE